MEPKHNNPESPTDEPTQPQTAVAAAAAAAATNPFGELVIPSQRKRLPDTRQSVTHKFNISGHEGYLIVGLYEDGKPGELFIKLAKEGSTLAGLADTIGILTSLCLQHGVPVETLAQKFSKTSFEPAGHTNNPEIPIATSLSDYIFRWLEITVNDNTQTPAQQTS